MNARSNLSLDKNKFLEVLGFAIPAILESILVSLLMTVDTYIVSSLGTDSVSSVALTIQPVKLLTVIFVAFNTSITKHVAQYLGKNDKQGACALIKYGLKLTLILSVIIVAFGCIFADGLMELSGSNADSHTNAVIYFRLILLGTIPSNISLYLNAVKRGCKNSKISIYSNAVSNIVNITFDCILIYGAFGIASLGVAGAAIASDLGYVSALIISVISFRSAKDFVTYSDFKAKHPVDVEMKKSFLDMGRVLFSELVLTRIGFMIISAITARIGTEAMAVDKVAMNFLDIVFSFGAGLQAAAITMVGKSLGANDKKAIKDYSKITLILAVLVSIVLSLVFWFFGEYMILLYFPEANEEILLFAAGVSTVCSLIVYAQIPQLVLNGILRGLGASRTSFKISVFSILVIQVAGAFIMIYAMDWGLAGKWIASLIAQVVWVLLLAISVRRHIKIYNLGE